MADRRYAYRPSRVTINTHVKRLRVVARKLLREVQNLSGDSQEEVVAGLSVNRVGMASLRRIRNNPTAFALYERGFAEERMSALGRHREQRRAPAHRAGPPDVEEYRQRPPAYQFHDDREPFRVQQPPQQQLPPPPPALQLVERWIEIVEMESANIQSLLGPD